MNIDLTKDNILLICESPNKVKTISQILKSSGYKNINVQASVGHISYIKDTGLYNMGIDINNKFEASYDISPTKIQKVQELKALAKKASLIILATDPDREGEAIAWHLKHFLNIPENKYKRVTYHEITKKAILEALNNPRKIDDDLVEAAKTRQKLDKIVGYRLSPIAKKNTSAISVGRCQSAGLKILTERELEIRNFKPETYYELYLLFEKNSIEYRAKYIGTASNQQERFKSLDILNNICEECKKHKFIVKSIVRQEKTASSKLPFTTSTFQQEVSSKLGISVSTAMSCAQTLFEGIDVNGQHLGLITYIRTDSAEYAPEFLPLLKEHIISNYGKKYFAPVKKAKKKENVQDGHEAIRPVDLSMTPEKLKSYISDKRLIDVYSIIYNRTLASSMSDAVYSETIYTINNGEHLFVLSNKELIFDGFKKVYTYKDSTDDSDDISLIQFEENEVLKKCSLDEVEKQTKAPKRYTEASFIKTLDKLGIGRPSTYATIVNVLLDKKRNYCVLKDKNIVPTELGIELSSFLDKSFSDIINISYTAEMEKDLDLIAQGKLNSIDFLSTFYNTLKEDISHVDKKSKTFIETDKICPECGKKLVVRKSRYGEFLGCSGYPKCKYIEKIKK